MRIKVTRRIEAGGMVIEHCAEADLEDRAEIISVEGGPDPGEIAAEAAARLFKSFSSSEAAKK